MAFAAHDLSEVRKRAWQTRREKYGARGHGGSYSRGPHEPVSRPLIECEDGYPTDKSLRRLKRARFDFRSAARFLIKGFPEACSGISCCSIDLADEHDVVRGDGKKVYFSTGGWSGAEDLIGVMLGHHALRYFQESWHRGGHYTFFVPANFL